MVIYSLSITALIELVAKLFAIGSVFKNHRFNRKLGDQEHPSQIIKPIIEGYEVWLNANANSEDYDEYCGGISPEIIPEN